MSRIIAMTVAAALMATTANASSYFGSSSWSVEENASKKKKKHNAETLIGGVLALIGFDEKFSADARFDGASSTRPFDGAKRTQKQCDEDKTPVTTLAKKEEDEAGGAESEISGPEPILFAF